MEQAAAVWCQLQEVDRLTVLNIVDNETDGGSTPCSCCSPGGLGGKPTARYASEFTRLTQDFFAGKMDCIHFERDVALAGHGLSLLLVAEVYDQKYTLLLDGGPHRELWAINAKALGVDVGSIDACVLSHWHPDHSVGLETVAHMASAARAATAKEQADRDKQEDASDEGRPSELVFDLHPRRPFRRGMLLQDGRKAPFNSDVQISALEQPGCRVELHAEPHSLLNNTFYVSGEIPRVCPFETGFPPHATQWTPDPESWEHDPHIMDERCVAVKVRGHGVVVFTSCSHAGVVNVATHITNLCAAAKASRESAKGTANDAGPVAPQGSSHKGGEAPEEEGSGNAEQLVAVVGGLHLIGGKEMEARAKDTAQELEKLLAPHGVVLAGHCTGWRGKTELANTLPGRYQPCVVGGQWVFEAHE